MYIYKVTNNLNGKIYIGQSNYDNPSYFGSGKIIQSALKKYGKNNFIKEILEECNSQEELNEREIFWISELNSTDHNIGYNLQLGGKGGKHSEETKKLMSDSKLGDKNSFFGKYHSEETKQILSEKKKEHLSNKENHPFYNKKFTDEHKQKLRENHVDVSGENNPMYRRSFKDVREEKYGKEEADKLEKDRANKISQSLKGRVREDISKRVKGENNPFFEKTHSNETKKLLSELKSIKVLQYTLDDVFIKEWPSMKEVRDTLNIQCGRACKGLATQAGGYKWKFKNEENDKS